MFFVFHNQNALFLDEDPSADHDFQSAGLEVLDNVQVEPTANYGPAWARALPEGGEALGEFTLYQSETDPRSFRAVPMGQPQPKGFNPVTRTVSGTGSIGGLSPYHFANWNNYRQTVGRES